MKIIVKIPTLVICLVCILSSCVTSKDTNLLQDIKANHPELTVPPEEYRIIPGDLLTINVYALDPNTARLFASYSAGFAWRGFDESTAVSASYQLRSLESVGHIRPVTVYADGTITFPYIGKIYVKGYTLLEAKNLISRKLDQFAEGTSADVTLANRYFSILGEGGADRVTMTSTSMTIFQALAISTTIGAYGDRSKVTIIRQNATGSVTKTFDLRSKDIIDTEFYYIQPNDVIYVPQMKRKFLGSTTSFTGVFGLLTSVAGVIVVILRVF
ncbi:MAG: polysaccharide biosynthesis/export family protein [Dysgonomonas sp.]|nr:polysaccharide biosynthesis/export family protein [Dysgonomonas sp.]